MLAHTNPPDKLTLASTRGLEARLMGVALMGVAGVVRVRVQVYVLRQPEEVLVFGGS